MHRSLKRAGRMQPTSSANNALFHCLPAAEQRARILLLTLAGLSAPTIASMAGMQSAEVERIIAEAP
jgi:hypothetical protein